MTLDDSGVFVATDPWFKMYSRDLLMDPDLRRLPLAAQGLLLRMWCVCHEEGSLPDDVEEVALLTRCKLQEVQQCILQCKPFFILRDGKLYSKRMEREKRLSETRRKSANQRWHPTDSVSDDSVCNAKPDAKRDAIRTQVAMQSPDIQSSEFREQNAESRGSAFVCNQASAAREAELHTQKTAHSLNPTADVSVERVERYINNISSTRAFNGPETVREPLPGDHPHVLDFVAEARRLKAEQEQRTAANSLDSAASRVDKSLSGTNPSENGQNPEIEMGQNRAQMPQDAKRGATPHAESQTPQEDGKARDGKAKELPVETYSGVQGEVLPPDGSVLPGDKPDWVELILSLYGKGRHAHRAKTAVIDAITREVAQGRQPNDAAAASWLFEQTQRFMDIYATWPAHETKFLWDASQFFKDGHYADDESTWRRDERISPQHQRDIDTAAAVERVIQRVRPDGSNLPGLPVPSAPEAADPKRSTASVVRAGLGGFASVGVGHGVRAR